MCTSSRGRARPPPGTGRHRLEPAEHTAGDAPDARAGHIIEMVRLISEDGACRTHPAADGGTDAFPEIARRQARGIARDEGVLAPYDLHLAAQVIAVAGRVVLRLRGEPLLERRHEVRAVRADVLAARVHALGAGADA